MLLCITGMAGTGKSYALGCLGEAAGEPSAYAAADEFESDIPYAFVERIFGTGLTDDVFVDPAAEPIDVARKLIVAMVPHDDKLRVICLDDLQWADEQSARVLRYVIPRVIRRGVLVAAAAREPYGQSDLIGTLVGHSETSTGFGHIRIEPLSADQIRQLALERFGAGISMASAERLRDATGGIYLAVDTLFSTITASEIQDLHFNWNLPIRMASLPESPLLAGYARLDESARLAVMLASLAQRELSRSELERAAAVLGSDIDVNEACRQGLLVESGFGSTVAIAHNLFARAVRDTIAPAYTRALHRALETVSTGRAAVTHAMLGAEEWTPETVRMLDAHVTKDIDEGRFTEAGRLLKLSLRVANGSDRERLLLSYALLNIQAKTGYRALGYVEEIRAIEPSAIRDTMLSVLCTLQQRHDEAQEYIDAVLRRTETDADTRTIQSFAAYAMAIAALRSSNTSRVLEVRALASQIWREAPVDPAELTDPRLSWMVMPRSFEVATDAYCLSHVHLHEGTARLAELVPDLVTRALELDDSDVKIDTLSSLAISVLMTDNPALSLELTDEGTRLLSVVPTPPWAAGSLRLVRAQTFALLGRLVDAETVVHQARDLAYEVLDIESRQTMAALDAWLRAIMGTDDPEAPLAEARRLASLPWEPYGSDLAVTAECQIAMVAEDPQRIVDVTDQRHVARFEETQRGYLTYRAHALIELGRLDDAAELIEWLTQERGSKWSEMRGTLIEIRARYAHARGDDAVAEARFRVALGESERISPLVHGIALARFGEFLCAQDRVAEGEPYLRRSLRQLRDIGAHAHAARVAARVARIAEAAEKLRVSTWDLLTARERQIADLIADGASNNEIADELFVTPATVRFHVSNLLRKLGVERRTAIARVKRSQNR